MYMGQDSLFVRIENIDRYKKLTKRLITPEENLVLFQKIMNGYINIYESLAEFLFRHDKTALVHLIKVVSRLGLFVSLILYFMPI